MKSRIDTSFFLCMISIALFLGILPPVFSVRCVQELPQWLKLILMTFPIQAAYILSCVLPARKYCPDTPFRTVLDLTTPAKKELPMIVFGTFGVYLALGGITGGFVLLLKKFGVDPRLQEAVEIIMRGSPASIAVMIFAAGILAPVGEELVFRHVITKKLEPLAGPATAAVATSLLFAVVHMNIQAFPALFLLGLWLTFLYRKTGSLLSAMMGHMIFNLTTILILLIAVRAKDWFSAI